MSTVFEAYITNLGKYAEGQLVGETLKFPATTEEVQSLLKNIGVDGVRYEEFFITAFDGDVMGLYDYLTEYENLDELNHTLLERDMRKEDLRLAAGMTTNMIANMSKEGKHISMDTLARICETLNCEITDVIELVPDEPASTGGKEHERIETKNNGKRN